MSGTQRRMTADERERLMRLRVEQASQELASALMDYADWLLVEIREGPEGWRNLHKNEAAEVKEILEHALHNYGLAVGS